MLPPRTTWKICTIALVGWCVGTAPGQADDASVNASILQVRENPLEGAAAVELLFEGDRVEVIEQAGAWVRVQTGTEISGWVPASELEFTQDGGKNAREPEQNQRSALELLQADANGDLEQAQNDGVEADTGESVDIAAAPVSTVGLSTAYPEVVAIFEADCAPPQELASSTFTNSLGDESVSFYCWDPPIADAPRHGEWLGTVPTSSRESFGSPLTCNAEDTLCQGSLPKLKDRYREQLADAELSCATRQGVLFLQPQNGQVEVRCGFFATTVYDLDNDGEVDYSDPVSVDTLMFSADLAP